jgi:hypothetical protein
MTQTTPLGTRVAQYIQLRNKIKQMDDEHDAKMKPFKDALVQLNGIILAGIAAEGVESIATPLGTAYRYTKKSATIADGSEFRRFVIGSEAFDLVDWRANAKAVEDFINENGGNPPPGVNYNETALIGVRKK